MTPVMLVLVDVNARVLRLSWPRVANTRRKFVKRTVRDMCDQSVERVLSRCADTISTNLNGCKTFGCPLMVEEFEEFSESFKKMHQFIREFITLSSDQFIRVRRMLIQTALAMTEFRCEVACSISKAKTLMQEELTN